MSNDFVGCIAISKDGHDRGNCYVITGVIDDKFCLVANGENRLLAAPKRKNIRHLSISKNRTAATCDIEIVKVLKDFKERGVNE